MWKALRQNWRLSQKVARTVSSFWFARSLQIDLSLNLLSLGMWQWLHWSDPWRLLPEGAEAATAA